MVFVVHHNAHEFNLDGTNEGKTQQITLDLNEKMHYHAKSSSLMPFTVDKAHLGDLGLRIYSNSLRLLLLNCAFCTVSKFQKQLGSSY